MAPPVPLDDELPGCPWVSSSRWPAHPAAPLGGGGWGSFGIPRALGGPGNDSTLAPHPASPSGRGYRLDWEDLRDIHEAGVPVEQDNPSAQADKDNKKGLLELSAIRQQAVALCYQVLPAPYLSKNYKANPYHLTKDNPRITAHYSTCGEFPCYIVWLLQGQPQPGRFGAGTTALEPQGIKRGAWRVPNGIDWPKPGDLYALCHSDVLDGSCDHVGVILDPSGTVWTTGDWGQPDDVGQGFAGKFVTRAFDPERGTLSGDAVIGHNPRAIKGWIDLDAYFAK